LSTGPFEETMAVAARTVLHGIGALPKTSTTKHLRDERRLREVFDLIPELAWCAAPDGRLKFCNKSWLNSTGLAREQAEGSGWTSVLHAEDAPKLQQIWQSALVSGTAAEGEARMRTADSSYR
jgi:PAS domain S-box-containing protein